MLDKRTGALMNALNALCENGAYKILSVEDILAKLPARLGAGERDVREGLEELRRREYIRVKYEDDAEFCLCTLPKGRLFYESREEERESSAKARRRCFLSGFLGGAAGSLLAAAAAAACYFFLL